jgi:hypothetical protein
MKIASNSLCQWYMCVSMYDVYSVISAQADWTLTHTSHEDTEQSTIEASITLDGVTLTDY